MEQRIRRNNSFLEKKQRRRKIRRRGELRNGPKKRGGGQEKREKIPRNQFEGGERVSGNINLPLTTGGCGTKQWGNEVAQRRVGGSQTVKGGTATGRSSIGRIQQEKVNKIMSGGREKVRDCEKKSLDKGEKWERLILRETSQLSSTKK